MPQQGRVEVGSGFSLIVHQRGKEGRPELPATNKCTPFLFSTSTYQVLLFRFSFSCSVELITQHRPLTNGVFQNVEGSRVALRHFSYLQQYLVVVDCWLSVKALCSPLCFFLFFIVDCAVY